MPQNCIIIFFNEKVFHFKFEITALFEFFIRVTKRGWQQWKEHLLLQALEVVPLVVLSEKGVLGFKL